MKLDYDQLLNRFHERIPTSQIFTDEMQRLAYGTDASFYRLIPKIVVKAKNSNEAQFIIKQCFDLQIPLTFRAAGTSLSGQAVSDSVLMVIDRNWSGHKISEDRSEISLEPAVLGGHANSYLKPYDKKIGPDPASINAAMVAGIAANNASGMCCGTAQNSYKTLKSMKIIFADGSELDTGDDDSIANFRAKKSDLLIQINALSEKTKSDGDLTRLIRHKYKMKNTTGYSLNSIIDFEDPVEILQHLMIGSEGTLGFISEITYRTVPEAPYKASALINFKNIYEACRAVFILKKQPVDAVELMDRASLRSVENKPGMPEYLKTFGDEITALLIETSTANKTLLHEQTDRIMESLSEFDLFGNVEFLEHPEEYARLWNIRKGLFPSVGAIRKAGTTVIIEDVAFPLDKLADATVELQSLFKKYEYDEAIIFGHSLEGNLHFVFNQDFNNQSEIERYKGLMNEVVEMTAGKYGGSLKAEHGTGRNMAPFVEYEWGEKAFALMKEIKNIFDPQNILNPGVILNPDKNIYVKNLKPMPKAHELIDKCIECGFCESVCPSKNITLTPRQRIAVFRHTSELGRTKGKSILKNWESSFNYAGKDTCAVDGLCSLQCPVDIDTGKMIKELRFQDNSDFAKSIAKVIAGNTTFFTELLRIFLDLIYLIQKAVGRKTFESSAGGLRRISGNKVPEWNPSVPKGADRLPRPFKESLQNKAVYFPSCISRSFGVQIDGAETESQTIVMRRLLRKAGYGIIYPKNISKLCCGMPWASKGFFAEADSKSAELVEALKKVSENGKLPILFDTSPCVNHIKEFIKDKIHEGLKLEIYEPVEFIDKFLLNKLTINKIDATIAIHTTCSSSKMQLEGAFKRVAETCAENVIVPEKISCCGSAGDRGFTHPELSESALEPLRAQVHDHCSAGYSNSRTCEISLSHNSGIEYKSIVYLVDKAAE